MTSVYLGPLWVRNLFDNLKSSATWFAPWPQWDDDPVLVCGAGVSLESVLPWVSARRRSWRILAVDTALSILKSWSLIPDAVVCLEAQHANLRDFSGWSGTPVPLFADLTSFPPTTRIFEKPPHWFISEFAPLSLWSRWPWDAEVPRLPPLGSVGVVAAWIAWRLTRGPVVLAGLDFSFPPGQSHARGAPSLSALASRTDRFRPMEQPESWERPGLYRRQGMRWLTTPVMEGYAGLLSQEAASYAHRTWVWKKEGVPLGLPVWEGESSRPALPERQVLGARAQDRPSDWLSQERKRWDKILENFTLLNASPEDDAVWNLLEAKLREVDYLTFSFPDPQPRRTSDWLIRALTQVRWIVNRLSAGG
jgi:hypothetical protein